MATANYTVTGMTCGNCVHHVTEEVSNVTGVSAVDVDLASGSMVVTSEAPIAFDLIKDAVAEAGEYVVTAA